MKHLSWIMSLCVALLSAGCHPSSKPQSVRLMTYNICHASGMDDQLNIRRTAEVILRANPDVVAVQEIDSMTQRCQQQDILRALADETDMYPVFAPAIDYDGGKYGIGVLSKEQPIRWLAYPLPGREEARTLLVVEFERYVYACVHLSLTEEDRMLSLQCIHEVCTKLQKPFFIAGDWNAIPSSPFIQSVQKDFYLLTDTTAFTFPADHPDRVLDYIALDQQHAAEWELLYREVMDEPVASDHRPVIVDVKAK